MLLCVDPDAYASSAQIFGEYLAQSVATVGRDLQAALEGGVRMAGHDPAGLAWGDRYDTAAGQAVQVIDDLRRAAVNVGALLQASGFNHARAEAYSNVTGGGQLPPERLSYDPGFGVCVSVPSCAGGELADLPQGWEMIESAAGVVWPDGDTGKLRTVAAAWNNAADGLDAAWPLVSEGIAALDEQISPEIEHARLVCRSLGEAITEIVAQCRAIGQSAAEQADNIDKAHNELRDEVVQFLAITVAIEAAAAVAGVFTAGIGEVAGQVAEGAEVTNVLTRITLILARLLDAASLTGGRMAATALDGVGDGLRAVLAKTPVIAEMTPVTSALKTLDLTASKLARSPWLKGPSPRGFAVEARLGGNLPANFPTIDRFDRVTGVATSIKSIDVGAKTYLNPSGLRSTLKQYIDTVAGFRDARYGGVEIKPFEVSERVLQIGIPRGASEAQMAVFDSMTEYAAGLVPPVKLIVEVVR